MATQNNNKFFSKGRRTADSLKITYIFFATLAAIIVFFHNLPIVLVSLFIFGGYPIWNIVDGIIDAKNQKKALKQSEFNEQKLNALFNWFALGFVSVFTLGLCVVAAITQLTALLNGTATVAGIPLIVMTGPVGCITFAITMLWLTIRSLHQILLYNKALYHDPNNPELISARNIMIIDCLAWLCASIGSSGIAILTLFIIESIAVPTFIITLFTVFILASASLKCYQLIYHPLPEDCKSDLTLESCTKSVLSHHIKNESEILKPNEYHKSNQVDAKTEENIKTSRSSS